jgi:hypothetical protein
MKETPRRRITATSSFNKISTDPNPKPQTFLQQASGQISKDDVNGFSSSPGYLLHDCMAGTKYSDTPPLSHFPKMAENWRSRQPRRPRALYVHRKRI